jgi:hypothetical protein
VSTHLSLLRPSAIQHPRIYPRARYSAAMPLVPLDNMHDATLISIKLDWESGTCVASFRGGPTIPGGPFLLRWTDVSDLHIPRTFAWGPSVSVLLAVEDPPGCYALQLQSGDVITVKAGSIAFEQ